MDAKYLAEIRARCEAVENARYGKSGKSYEIACWKLKMNALADIPALLAEVERLTDIEKEYLHYRRISEKLDQQIATLKKALEIASSEVNTAFETLVEHHVMKYVRKANNVQDNVDAWIQKARGQLTHESTHGSDKSALKQEEKS